MRIRWLATINGMVEGIEGGVQRGQICDLPDDNARRYIRNSLATADLKSEELPEPYLATEESEALREWAAQQLLAQVPEEVRYGPEIVIGGRQKARQGWMP